MALTVYQAFLVAMAAIFVGIVRCGCTVIAMKRLEKECVLRGHEVDRLEREIVLARLNCAAANPEAAAILSEWEATRKHRMGLDDLVIYDRFFNRCMGGESRATPISK